MPVVICPRCHQEVPVTPDGRMYSHDDHAMQNCLSEAEHAEIVAWIEAQDEHLG